MLLSANVLLSCAAGCALCWAQGLCVTSGTLVWEELQGTLLDVPFPPCPPSTSVPPTGQALLSLLCPSVTVMHFCEPAKAP